MPVYKITLLFGMESYGWSESYYVSLNAATPLSNVFNNYGIPLGVARQALSGLQALIKWVRISQVGTPFAVQVFDVQSYGWPPYPAIAGPQNNALLVRCQPTNAGPNKNIFLRGMYNAAISQDDWSPSYDWLGAFQSFSNLLTGNQKIGLTYGWWGVIQKASAPVIGYSVSQTTYQVTINTGPIPQTQQPLFASVAVGQKVLVRFSGINVKSELNGTQVCLGVDGNHVMTKEQFGVIPFNRQGNAELPVFGFIQFGGLFWDRMTTRKAGRPFFLERGRQRNRAKT